MKKYILALDQGTTSSRAILFDKNRKLVKSEQKEFSQYFPKSGWVEHDANEILLSQLSVMKSLLESSNEIASEVAGIGITNQRETTVVWERASGKPVYNAIVWQDKRTTEICKQLRNEGLEDYIRDNTGLVIDAYFSATKIRWILDNIERGQERAEASELLFGTIDSWLIYNLTKGVVHATDYTNASRTMLFNIRTLEWDNKLLSNLNIPKAMLPEVRYSSSHFGSYNYKSFDIPICGVAGDQQAALFGQKCWSMGMAKNTYGTGCFMLMNTGKELIKSNSGLLTTIACGLGANINYALEGSVFIAGAAIQWLRDGMKFFEDSAESEAMAKSVDSTDGVYMVPAFNGLGAPYWDMNARGAILGISRGTKQEHIVRAALESLAYQTKDVLDAMEKDSSISLQALKVDGGASNNNFLMQFQADILDVSVIRGAVTESTALGAAMLAGLAIEFYNKNLIEEDNEYVQKFESSMPEDERQRKYQKWKDAVGRAMHWVEKE